MLSQQKNLKKNPIFNALASYDFTHVVAGLTAFSRFKDLMLQRETVYNKKHGVVQAINGIIQDALIKKGKMYHLKSFDSKLAYSGLNSN